MLEYAKESLWTTPPAFTSFKGRGALKELPVAVRPHLSDAEVMGPLYAKITLSFRRIAKNS